MSTPIRPLLMSGMVLAAAVALSPVCSAQPDQGAPSPSNSRGAAAVAASGATKINAAPAKSSPRLGALRGLANVTQGQNLYDASAVVQSQMSQMSLQNQLMLTTMWAPPVIFLAS